MTEPAGLLAGPGVAYDLPDDARSAFAAAVGRLRDGLHLPEGYEPDPFRRAAAELPSGLRELLAGFRRHGSTAGAVVVRNVPIDADLPPTPADGNPSPVKPHRVSEYALLTLASLLGEPVGYEGEKGGAIVHDVCPVAGRAHLQENVGAVRLDFHTENAHHAHRPDHVLLLCLRPDPAGAAVTWVASRDGATRRLSAEHRAVLATPTFVFHPPPSFHGAGRPGRAGQVLAPAGDGARLRFDLHHTEATTPAGRAALDAVADALAAAERGIRLTSGDVLVLDNALAAHARSSFTPAYDGTDRWLQRVYTVRALDVCQGCLPEGRRVLPASPRCP